MPRVHIETGVSLDYVDLGAREGTPVLLIHGYLDSWRIWESTLPYLSTSFRLIAVTLRGFGDSDKPEHGYKMTDFARDIDAFMDAIEIPSAIVVGHSMGGFIAHQLATEYPDRVLKLILVGTSCTGEGNDALGGSAMEATLALEDPVPAAFIKQAQCEQIVFEVPDSRLEAILHESRKVPARVLKGAMLGMLTENHQHRLKEINVPTLICFGDGDIFFTLKEQQKLVTAIPAAALKIYTGVGHGVQWEVPEEFANDLNEFIDTQ